MKYILIIGTGVFAGILSGLVGIGGGVIIIPILIYGFKFSQFKAQGTTLALMVPPIGIVAAYMYYLNGYVNITAAIFISIGFIIGGYIGSKIAVKLSSKWLNTIFGCMIILIGISMIIIR